MCLFQFPFAEAKGKVAVLSALNEFLQKQVVMEEMKEPPLSFRAVKLPDFFRYINEQWVPGDMLREEVLQRLMGDKVGIIGAFFGNYTELVGEITEVEVAIGVRKEIEI